MSSEKLPELPVPPKLLDRVRSRCRLRHFSIRTEEAYVDWCRRFILFHGKKHPHTMGGAEIEAFLTHLAVERNLSASTQNQSFSAILFLSCPVLNLQPPSYSKRPNADERSGLNRYDVPRKTKK